MAFIYIIQLQIPVITFKDIVQFTVKSKISVKKFMAFYLPMFFVSQNNRLLCESLKCWQ